MAGTTVIENILCECESWSCRERITITSDVYEWLRGAHPTASLVIPEHVSEDDTIVGSDSHDQFVLVVTTTELRGYTCTTAP